MNKILIIGQGNIGTFLGATLNFARLKADNYVRKSNPVQTVVLNFNDRRSKEFQIKKGIPYIYSIISDTEKIREYDYIIVPVAHYHLKEVFQMLLPCTTPNQTIIVMGNVWWSDFAWIEKNWKTPYVFAFPNFGGAVVNEKLEGWLTPNFTIGSTNPNYQNHLDKVENLLNQIGFKPHKELNIKAWLTIHFAYNAGMLLEAAKQGGFQTMTRSTHSIKNMYLTMRECLNIVKNLGIDIQDYKEGKEVFQAIWWNVLKMYFIFLIPGLAKSADATKNIDDWKSYSQKLWTLAQERNIPTPILTEYYGKV
ncbi:MAG: hypothetical protein MUE81_02325 [Thermoflexibacter sp.]|jgi:2-dehydropantoate 2-reductase|nr:hypothetical protein [Thermoflexibacter sp.]